MANITLLPSAKVPLVYDGDNTMTTEWYRFFWNIYGFTGTGVIPVDKGGTGLDTIGDHQLIIGNANNVFEPALLSSASIAITYPAGFINLELGTSGVTPGTYGSASTVGVFTVNQYGVLTAASNTSIGIDASQIVSGTLPVIRGGTGQSTYTDGQLLIGNTTGNTLTKATLTAGTGISVSNSAGSITIANTGVLSVSGTAPVVSSGGATPAISMAAANTTTNGYLTSTDWNTFNNKAPATSGTSILYGNGSGGFSNVTIGSGISFAGGTLSATGSGGTVTSVSGTGTVNGITLTGTVTSSGSLTLGGTLSGIGNSQLTNSTISGVALGGNLFNLTAGTGVSFSAGTTYNGSAAITINATGTGGTVTSVAALTLGTTGTDLSSTVANSTTTPVITLNVPTASATNRGALSSTDWTTFNSKANAFTYTANYIPYGQGTTTPAQSSALQFDGITFSTANDASISTITAGLGGGAVATNTVFGNLAFVFNSTGARNAAFGKDALQFNTASNNAGFGYRALFKNTATGNSAFGYQAAQANTSGTQVAAFGYNALAVNTTGSEVSAFGYNALASNTTGGGCSAFGTYALQSNGTANYNTAFGDLTLVSCDAANNTAVGYGAGYSTTGIGNQFFGYLAGNGVTSGAKNVIVGSYTGAAAPISATGSNYVVLSDGDGNIKLTAFPTGGVSIGNTTDPGAGNLRFATAGANGIYFGAGSQLNSYETGTWTPVYAPTTGSFTSLTMIVIHANYTRIGRQVFIEAYIATNGINTAGGSGNLLITGLPYASANGDISGCVGNGVNWTNYPASVVTNAAGGTSLYLDKQGLSSQIQVSDMVNAAGVQNLLTFSINYRV